MLEKRFLVKYLSSFDQTTETDGPEVRVSKHLNSFRNRKVVFNSVFN